MAYTYEQVFAADPANPANVAGNTAVTIFAPGDGTMTPLEITDPDGQPLANPIIVNANGFGSAFAHATLDRVAWAGGSFTGFFTSYEGMKEEAVAAREAAETAAAGAAAAAQADLEARIAAGDFTGAPGINGSNVLPTDTAIKNAIEDGASATRAALDAAIGSGNEYFDDFSKHPDGPLAKALTGQTYSQHFIAPEAEVKVTGGYATYSNTADLGGYASVLLDDDVVWFGGTFKFTSWSTGGGLAVFAAAEEDIKATINAGQGIPRLAAHLIVTPENISMDVNLTKGGSVTSVFNKVFTTPLLADDTTEYSAWVALDKKRGKAYVIDPYGSVTVITHDGFKIPARWHFFEPFRSTGATGKTLPKFRTVQADSRNKARVATIAATQRAQAALQATAAKENFDTIGAGDHTQTITTTPSEVPGTLVTFTVPPSGSVLVALEGLINVTVAGPVHFGIMDGANALVSVRTAATEVNHSGRASVRLPYSPNAQPGELHTVKMCVYKGNAATASLVMGNFGTSGNEIYSAASLTVSPL